MRFQIKSEFKPTGDQPQAIRQLTNGIKSNDKYQTLLGVTGSGKTFTVANVIEEVQKPTWSWLTIKRWRRNCIRSSSNSFLIMQ